MTPARNMREFSHEEVQEAMVYIESLPPDVRVYVDEWVDSDWRFVFGDERDYALRGLSRLTTGARFRIRPAYLNP
jgi:hypothetical protein